MLRTILTTVLITLALHSSQGNAFFDLLGALDAKLDKEEKPVPDLILSDLTEKLERAARTTTGFSDIDPQGWYARFVTAVARWGIVSGYNDARGNPLGIFGPADPVTVAEILKMSLKAVGIDEARCLRPPLHPHARGHWSERFVACAEERNFRLFQLQPPLNRPALRAEVLTVIHDAFSDSIPSLLSLFNDTQDHPYEADIAYASAMGVVSGDTDFQGMPLGTFRPDDRINRAEAAKIVYQKLRVKMSEEIGNVQGTPTSSLHSSSSKKP